ncbi:hypothetical protein HJC23_000862 [Cyclotella cryptica]|uniref:Sulfate transporter n=1 Tax=Cyclotella cryptica TaxID=29204 RepID=A0ABD3PSY1_9STRA
MEASTVLRKSYGSVGGGELRSANNSSPQPIHLHPTLDALDVGPHAFRSSVPQPISQSPETKTLDVSQNRRMQCLSMPATLNSPLLRRNFSSPGDKLKSEKHSTLPQSYDPSLCTPMVREKSPDHRNGNGVENSKEETNKNESFLYYVIYAFVNSIMCLPCLYGYASVIFNHAIYQPHINALSKLVIFSSVIHQCCFTLFSTLPFSIGQVQDAGLIFLSAMSNKIASRILEDPGGDAEDVAEVILSTTIVLLGLATASLGAVLILMGKFRLADVVAYLPLPVVGGYLAFIGYFCLEAGVALCINDTIMKPSDWTLLLDEHSLLLAIPGILSGIALTAVARKCEDEAMLPISMVVIPVVFYIVLFTGGWTIEEAREGGWVGETSPPVPVVDLFHLVDFGKVRWDLFKDLIPTWLGEYLFPDPFGEHCLAYHVLTDIDAILGMTFVVSFSSCLDVAAISMDMGQALDTNNELMTVGISNFVSGCLGGFTGSYIFSQTIFTSRWIGILVGLSFLAVVISTVNFLEITPLFFLGSTLIFIGFDLMYEWIAEVRHKLLLSEYLVLLATFVAIQFLGIDGGIGLGIVVAIFDFVLTTASVSSVSRIRRRSLAFYGPQERAYIENNVYSMQYPKILILEVRGAVFFGSSIQVLSNILDAAGINASIQEKAEISRVNSPLPHHSRMNSIRISESLSPASISPGTRRLNRRQENRKESDKPKPVSVDHHMPRFLVLDLSSVSNVDASAARGRESLTTTVFLLVIFVLEYLTFFICLDPIGCFLQLAKMCAARRIVVCAAGQNGRIDWIMQTHDCANHIDAEEMTSGSFDKNQKIILFDDLNDALQFCEKILVAEKPSNLAFKRFEDLAGPSGEITSISLSTAFTHFIGVEPDHAKALEEYEKSKLSFHTETRYKLGETIFCSGTNADGFYIVLSGSVVILKDGNRSDNEIVSGAGKQHVITRRNIIESGQVSRILSVGSIFGFVDFVLQRPRTFSVVAGAENVLIAKCHRDGLDRLKADNPAMDRIVDKVLLLCSAVELASRDP